MRRRLRVDVKHVAGQGFAAFKLGTGEPIAEYSNLSFGNTPAAQAGGADDNAASFQTFNSAADRTPNANAMIPGWVTVPD